MHTHTHTWQAALLGLAGTIYVRCIYGIFDREITKYTVYICIRSWPTLSIVLAPHVTRALWPRTN
jgi:hypothetical protein